MSRLEETLEKLDVGDARFEIKIRAESPADAEQNRQVYDEANKAMLEILRNRKLGKCIHITGEMRALADPVHRAVCRRIWETVRSKVDMACYLPRGIEAKGREILKWNRQNWKASWTHHLEAFDLLGDGIVNLYVTRNRERMHYSVFGDKYVLLQAEHPHKQHVKEVWLLESKPLNEALTAKGQEILDRCEYVPAREFAEVALSMSSAFALHILFSLEDAGKADRTPFYSRLEKLGIYDQSRVEDLTAMGFVRETGESIELTEDGRDYLRLFR